jgi:hypothetical protein
MSARPARRKGVDDSNKIDFKGLYISDHFGQTNCLFLYPAALTGNTRFHLVDHSQRHGIIRLVEERV